jgi:hypothetical protein
LAHAEATIQDIFTMHLHVDVKDSAGEVVTLTQIILMASLIVGHRARFL